ncbi:MAG: hypothetical protein ACREH9_00635 [Pseudomonadota bacterium]
MMLPVEVAAGEAAEADAGAGVVGVLFSRLVEAFKASDMFAPGPLAAPVLAPGVVLAALAEEDAEVEVVDDAEEVEVDEEAPAVDVPADPVELEAVVAAAETLNARTLSERLPRNCGAMSAEKFSAPVLPERRRETSTVPAATDAVRRVTADAAGV